jgi:FAD/FMN-containing dehydrogenase
MSTRSGHTPPSLRGAFHRAEEERGRFAEASGILRTLPAAVAAPHDADDLAALVRWASETRTPLVPRAAGTGMPGGNIGAGVAVDLLTRFRGIGGVDAVRQRVRVEPGVTRAELNAACAGEGLFFPVDPSSGERCTFGGMLANNSAGAHSVRYGATRGWVESLDVVLADGSRGTVTRGARPDHPRLREILWQIDAALLPQREAIEAAWPRVRKNSSGYALREYLRSGDAVDLLVGSEGTLALIVGAEVRLAPIPPHRGLALLEFTSLEDAGTAVEAVLELEPATCEILDRTFLELVRGAGADADYPLRPGLEAVLLVEVEGGSAAEVREHLERIATGVAGVADHTATATDPEQQHRMWHVRHAASPLIAARADGRVSMQFIEDGVVPVRRLPEYIRALRRTLSAYGVPAVIFGHAGDGNLHVNPLVDVQSTGWQAQIEEILYEIADEVAALGGTLAGEHGDGRLRAPLLETIWGSEMVARFRQVKEAFDPHGILNPGVILPLPGQRPLEALKPYDRPREHPTESSTMSE